MNCQLDLCDGRCVCRVCGRSMRYDPRFTLAQHRQACLANAPARDPVANPCRYFLGPTGQDVDAKKDCGCKTAEPKTALAECELFGLVTFIQPAADENLRCCQTCDRYAKD